MDLKNRNGRRSYSFGDRVGVTVLFRLPLLHDPKIETRQLCRARQRAAVPVDWTLRATYQAARLGVRYVDPSRS